MAVFNRGLFIFRRDLRLEDNLGLLWMLENASKVIPCFIFSPDQLERNVYRSDHCVQFMLESLEDLDKQLKQRKSRLYLFYGNPHEIVERCIKELAVDVVSANRDYTPYSHKRDEAIEKQCDEDGVSFHLFDDALLHPPVDTLKADGKPYTVFTPFFRNAYKIPVPAPVGNTFGNYFKESIPFAEKPDIYDRILPRRSLNQAVNGGRQNALQILGELGKYLDYATARDFPADDKTTHLSSYLKFTCCSPREVSSGDF